MPKSYSILTIEGAKADSVINCMRENELLPTNGTIPHAGVLVDPSGAVRVEQNFQTSTTAIPAWDKSSKNAISIGSVGDEVAAFDKGFAKTPEVTAVGTAGDQMHKKAIACAFKSIGLTP